MSTLISIQSRINAIEERIITIIRIILITSNHNNDNDSNNTIITRIWEITITHSHSNRNFQQTLSNAFSASTDKIRVFWYSESCMELNSLQIFIVGCLPLIKPVRSGWIRAGITFSKWDARTWLIILMSVFTRESGLIWLIGIFLWF